MRHGCCQSAFKTSSQTNQTPEQWSWRGRGLKLDPSIVICYSVRRGKKGTIIWVNYIPQKTYRKMEQLNIKDIIPSYLANTEEVSEILAQHSRRHLRESQEYEWCLTDLCFLDGDQTQIYGQMAENLFLQRVTWWPHAENLFSSRSHDVFL